MAFTSTAGSGEDSLRSALSKAELQALDALKLQYFQNATRCLAKGDYDNALAEIKRVLLIDPGHHLAREYEVRVNQLKSARAQAPKPSPVPLKQPPKSSPAPADVAPRAKPARSRKTLFYLALTVCVLVGTAGIVTLEKGNDAKQPPPPLAVADQAPAREVSAPAEEPVQSTYTEPTPLPTVPVASTGTKGAAAEQRKAAQETEDRERALPASSTPVRLASGASPEPAAARRSELTKSEKAPPTVEKTLEKVAEKAPEEKVAEKAPEKMELPAPVPEVKLAAAEPRVAEPPRESKPFVAIEKQPQIVHLEKVYLPDLVMRNHMSGEVTAKVFVNAEGKPQEVQIVSSTSSIFEQPVIDAISRSTFSPGMMGNGPVAAWVVIPFKFK